MRLLVSLCWLGLVAGVSAAPKFAVVRVTDIYRELPSTQAMQKQIQRQREAILQNKRAEQLRANIAELQSLQAKLQAKKDNPDEEDNKKLAREYEIKRQETETLRQEFEEFRAEEDKRINKEMVATMRASLGRILEVSQQIAKERNLDGVFDTSGNSNTGIPFVLYKADAPDLTEDVVSLLGEVAVEAVEESAPVEPKPESN
ncbi:MAG: OmpH family outer membrane protein [Armatimonadetes bacterium]|nr:OmpH family outer membrane protein [Akkermansiaceae bacterium]